MGGGRSRVSFRVQLSRESSQLPCSRATIQLPHAYSAWRFALFLTEKTNKNNTYKEPGYIINILSRSGYNLFCYAQTTFYNI